MHDIGQVVPSRRQTTCQTHSNRAFGNIASNSPGAQQPPERPEARQGRQHGLIRRVQDTTRFGVELLAHKGGDSENTAGCSGPLWSALSVVGPGPVSEGPRPKERLPTQLGSIRLRLDSSDASRCESSVQQHDGPNTATTRAVGSDRPLRRYRAHQRL